MAVPMFWRQKVLPNWNMLFSITKRSSFSINSVGISVLLNFCRYFSIVAMPSSGSMLVYIDSASDVKILEPRGNGPYSPDNIYFATTIPGDKVVDHCLLRL